MSNKVKRRSAGHWNRINKKRQLALKDKVLKLVEEKLQ